MAKSHKMTIPKLSKPQNKALQEILEGAEIQVHRENERYVYTMCYEDGNCRQLTASIWSKLSGTGLIKLKWRPAEDVERWA